MKSLFSADDLGFASWTSRNLHWSVAFPVDPYHNIGTLTEAKLERPNFLSFAIEQDVFTYVDWAFKTNGRSALAKAGKPLLASACGTDPFWRLITFTQPARMVRLLLANGADPNESFNGASCWQVALNVARRSHGLSYRGLGELAETFDLLLQAGANPHAKVEWTKSYRKRTTEHFERTAYEQIHLAFVQMESSDIQYATRHATWSDEERQQMAKKGQELLELINELMKKGQRASWGLQGWNIFSLRSLRVRLGRRLSRRRRQITL